MVSFFPSSAFSNPVFLSVRSCQFCCSELNRSLRFLMLLADRWDTMIYIQYSASIFTAYASCVWINAHFAFCILHFEFCIWFLYTTVVFESIYDIHRDYCTLQNTQHHNTRWSLITMFNDLIPRNKPVPAPARREYISSVGIRQWNHAAALHDVVEVSCFRTECPVRLQDIPTAKVCSLSALSKRQPRVVASSSLLGSYMKRSWMFQITWTWTQRRDDESWLAAFSWISMSIDIIEPRIACLASDVLHPTADS